MANVDRILQLKLVADVGDLNSKMGQVDGQVGKIGGAFRSLKGWIGPVIASTVLDGITELGDRLMGGIEAAKEAERIGAQLATTWDRLGLEAGELDEVTKRIGSRALSLGFDDDTSLQGFDKFLTITKDAEHAQKMLNVAMDVARKQGIPIEQAIEKVIGVYNGAARSTREFGFEGKKGMEAVEAAAESVAGAAETHMTTAEGRMERFNGRIDEIFEAIGGIILGLTEPFLDLMDALDPILVELQESIGPAFTALGEAAGPVFERIGEALGKVFTLFTELAPHVENAVALVMPYLEGLGAFIGSMFEAAMGIIDTFIALLSGDFTGAWQALEKAIGSVFDGIVSLIKGALNTVIGLWNSLDFAIDISIPNPAHGTILDPIGKPSIDFKTGDIIPDIPLLAKGGIATGPTLAMIGEGRYDEAVIPLDGRSMGNTYNITITGVITDPAATGRAIVEAIKAHERRSGAAWRAG